METVFDHRDVDIHDITQFEFFTFAGDAVTNHMIDRGADGFGIGRVARRRIMQRRGNGALLLHHIVVA